jgi:hypothetical protein
MVRFVVFYLEVDICPSRVSGLGNTTHYLAEGDGLSEVLLVPVASKFG